MALILLTPALQAAGCPPPAASIADLTALKAREFTVEDHGRRQQLAVDLLPCLAGRDPDVRDGVAFEALSTWMRGNLLSADTTTTIMERLVPWIAPAYPDPEGFARPFAALVLAEVARVDRISPFMSNGQRQRLAGAAAAYLESVRDYRGFIEEEGWRHGVAHGADLVLQLALNPDVGRDALDRMLSAAAGQVAPPAVHFYIHGESERLARAVFFIATRKLHSADEWRHWFERITMPAPLADWRDAYGSRAGLSKRHNTMAFLRTLYLYVQVDGDEIRDRLLPGLVEAIRRVP